MFSCMFVFICVCVAFLYMRLCEYMYMFVYQYVCVCMHICAFSRVCLLCVYVCASVYLFLLCPQYNKHCWHQQSLTDYSWQPSNLVPPSQTWHLRMKSDVKVKTYTLYTVQHIFYYQTRKVVRSVWQWLLNQPTKWRAAFVDQTATFLFSIRTRLWFSRKLWRQQLNLCAAVVMVRDFQLFIGMVVK